MVGAPVAADTKRFDAVAEIPVAEMRRKLGLDGEAPLVGIVARLQRWKGVHVYAEAMSAVCKEIPNACGVIVGGMHDLEPDYEPWLRNRIGELGMSEKIRMVGVQRNVPEWMQAMDVVVHASEREPFGIVVVEAMALGKPVVATARADPKKSSPMTPTDSSSRGTSRMPWPKRFSNICVIRSGHALSEKRENRQPQLHRGKVCGASWRCSSKAFEERREGLMLPGLRAPKTL